MKKLNRASKYIIVICVFLIGVNGALGYVLTRQSSGAMKSLMRSRMLDVSNTAAAMLDGDVLERLEAEDEDSPEYQAALKTLTYFQENIDLEYIYCIRDMGGGRFVFSIDPTVEDPGQFGDPITYTDALYQASLGTPSVDAVPYEDAWGRFYSAYTPVFRWRGSSRWISALPGMKSRSPIRCERALSSLPRRWRSLRCLSS